MSASDSVMALVSRPGGPVNLGGAWDGGCEMLEDASATEEPKETGGKVGWQGDSQQVSSGSENFGLLMSKDLEDQDGRRIIAKAEISLPEIGGDGAEVPSPNPWWSPTLDWPDGVNAKGN